MKMENEILKAIKEDRLYDFIANNYWKMSAEISRDLLLELIYEIYFNSYQYSSKEDRQGLNENLIESLKQNRDWEE